MRYNGGMSNTLRYHLWGSFTRDILAGGDSLLGGTVFYSAVQAHYLGAEVSVFASAAIDTDLTALPEGISVHLQASPHSMTFENIYDDDGNRIQYLRAKANPLDAALIPYDVATPDVLHIGPIFDETPVALLDDLPDTKIALTPQGYLRRREASGRVVMTEWQDAERMLGVAWATVFSEEDFAYDADKIAYYASLCPITVCTRNISAATLFVDGERSEIPTYPAQMIDPTGAGDVFAAAFFVYLHQTNDPYYAVDRAHFVAAKSIEGRGISSLFRGD